MNFLHRIRKLANLFLAPFSVALVPAETPPWLKKKIVTTRVGRFSIEVPSLNPLSTNYTGNPDYAGHLGRVARLLKGKYPDLAAIDIGANVGDTACIIKSAADIPLVCIEGDDYSFGFLARNIRQFKNTTAYKMFLGEKTETLGVSLDKGGWNTTLKPDLAAAALKIKVVSLDDFLDGQTAVDQYQLVKIDTEGFDCAILRGAKKFIERVHPVITFEYNRDNMTALGENGLDTLAMLADLGYLQVAIHDCYGRFFCMASLSDKDFIRDIHDYADGRNAIVYYYDLTLFHQSDSDVAEWFERGERTSRAGATPKGDGR